LERGRKGDAIRIIDLRHVTRRERFIAAEGGLVDVQTCHSLRVIKAQKDLTLCDTIAFLHHQAGDDAAFTVCDGLTVTADLKAAGADHGAIEWCERCPAAEASE
jgi:hypothetical protein